MPEDDAPWQPVLLGNGGLALVAGYHLPAVVGDHRVVEPLDGLAVDSEEALERIGRGAGWHAHVHMAVFPAGDEPACITPHAYVDAAQVLVVVEVGWHLRVMCLSVILAPHELVAQGVGKVGALKLYHAGGVRSAGNAHAGAALEHRALAVETHLV